MYTREDIQATEQYMFAQKERQTLELERAGIDSENNYVLWLICDMYMGFSGVKEGRVYIYTEDGQIIVEQATRKPYPNKCISHVSLCSGRKRIYGVPLSFSSIEDIKKIKNIVVIWDIYCIAYNKEQKPVMEWNRNIEAYNIRFDIDNDEDKRIFTLMSKSYYMGDEKYIEDYLAEFQSCQSATQIPGEQAAYFLAPEHQSKMNSFSDACNLLIIPGVKDELKMHMNAPTASLAYGVGWKEKDVYKAVYVLTADATLKNKEIGPAHIF